MRLYSTLFACLFFALTSIKTSAFEENSRDQTILMKMGANSVGVTCLERTQICKRMQFFTHNTEISMPQGGQVDAEGYSLIQKFLHAPQTIKEMKLNNVRPSFNIWNKLKQNEIAFLYLLPLFPAIELVDAITTPEQLLAYAIERAVLKRDLRRVSKKLQDFVQSKIISKPEIVRNAKMFGEIQYRFNYYSF